MQHKEQNENVEIQNTGLTHSKKVYLLAMIGALSSIFMSALYLSGIYFGGFLEIFIYSFYFLLLLIFAIAIYEVGKVNKNYLLQYLAIIYIALQIIFLVIKPSNSAYYLPLKLSYLSCLFLLFTVESNHKKILLAIFFSSLISMMRPYYQPLSYLTLITEILLFVYWRKKFLT